MSSTIERFILIEFMLQFDSQRHRNVQQNAIGEHPGEGRPIVNGEHLGDRRSLVNGEHQGDRR